MSFEEIVRMMENAVDYMDLYDAASYIVDDSLRVDVEQLIEQCEDDGDDVETAYSIVTSDLLDNKVYELNESLDNSDDYSNIDSVEGYVDIIQSVSNDKDLLNILDIMENNKSLDQDLVTNVRQLFRNNRFMPLDKKLNTIVQFINEYGNNKNDTKYESLTEALDTNIKDVDNSDKIDKSIETIRTDGEKNNIIDTLQKRVGQQFSVAELNKLLQTIFNQSAKIYLLASDLSNMNLDDTQKLEIEDDNITYVIYYDIIDIDNSIVELTTVNEEEITEES